MILRSAASTANTVKRCFVEYFSSRDAYRTRNLTDGFLSLSLRGLAIVCKALFCEGPNLPLDDICNGRFSDKFSLSWRNWDSKAQGAYDLRTELCPFLRPRIVSGIAAICALQCREAR